jgi:hypothetical protein
MIRQRLTGNVHKKPDCLRYQVLYFRASTRPLGFAATKENAMRRTLLSTVVLACIAGIARAETYDDCILENMKNVSSQHAVPARIDWTLLCKSGRLSHGINLTGFKG